MATKPINMLRVLLRPWWAKVVALVLVLFVVVGWYAAYIYFGYQSEQRAYTQITLARKYVPMGGNYRTNILPEWVTEYIPGVAEYGERYREILLPLGKRLDPTHFGELKYLTTLTIDIPARKIKADELHLLIKNIPHVKRLSLDSYTVTSEAARAIGNHQSLEYLSLPETFSGEETQHLKLITNSRSIRRLDFHLNDGPIAAYYVGHILGYDSDDESFDPSVLMNRSDQLEILRGFKSLQKLRIGLRHVTDKDVALLNSLPSLTHLNLTVYEPTEQDILNITRLKHLYSLSVLHFKLASQIEGTPGVYFEEGDAQLKARQKLDADQLPGLDLSPLKALAGLERLRINAGPIDNLEVVVPELKKLVRLEVNHYRSEPDYSYVKALKNTPIQSIEIELAQIDHNDASPLHYIPDHIVNEIFEIDTLKIIFMPLFHYDYDRRKNLFDKFMASRVFEVNKADSHFEQSVFHVGGWIEKLEYDPHFDD